MESGTKNQDPHSPSIRSPTKQPPLQKNSFEKRGSDVEEKPFQEDGKNFSSRLPENSTERRGLEPKTDKEENSKKTELKGRSSGLARSEAECCSNRESASKRKSSRDSPVDRTGASVGDERSVTLEKKKRKVPDAGPSGDSEETWDARPRKAQRGSAGRSKRRRSRSPGIQPPPLRKSLVTSLRAMSEAIYQNVVQIQNQWVPSSLNWEQLAQLRGRLCAQAQTFYTMATQAAYVFPAEGWLVPAPLPGPWRPAENGEAQSSS
nr:PREDICTED: protein FRG2-like-1 [Rhinolophus sinicus]